MRSATAQCLSSRRCATTIASLPRSRTVRHRSNQPHEPPRVPTQAPALLQAPAVPRGCQRQSRLTTPKHGRGTRLNAVVARGADEPRRVGVCVRDFAFPAAYAGPLALSLEDARSFSSLASLLAAAVSASVYHGDDHGDHSDADDGDVGGPGRRFYEGNSDVFAPLSELSFSLYTAARGDCTAAAAVVTITAATTAAAAATDTATPDTAGAAGTDRGHDGLGAGARANKAGFRGLPEA